MKAGRELTPEEEKFVDENKSLFYELYENMCEENIRKGHEMSSQEHFIMGLLIGGICTFMAFLAGFYLIP